MSGMYGHVDHSVAMSVQFSRAIKNLQNKRDGVIFSCIRTCYGTPCAMYIFPIFMLKQPVKLTHSAVE